ncbi:AMP-binding protein [Streptomyces sp. NRRL F-5727]|uniref:AMP-binding protein n=1 Tax=Streptomyces sp. NRRL F-5727 TaxID=1463871 RepID=UPI0004C6C609|nr:AMP-binding protein [Streptomyces sp. NRRL F-5727]
MTQRSDSGRHTGTTADTVLHRFEHWARTTPGADALVTGPRRLTYARLDARAALLARHLRASGLPSGGLVAVGVSDRTSLVVALLAVLKAGGAYAVLDAEHPHIGRRQLAAVEPFALLTRTADRAALDTGDGPPVVLLDTETDEESVADTDGETVPAPEPRPDDALPASGPLAARVFTAAAEPRAVPVTHDLLLAAYESWAEVTRVTRDDRHLIDSGADVTGFATGWTRALCSGGTLVLPAVPPRRAGTGHDLPAAVESERVTVLYAGPDRATELLARAPRPGDTQARHDPYPALRSLRLLAVTGDRLHLDEHAALHGLLRPGARVLNVYGLAETAGTGTWLELPHLHGPLDFPEGHTLLGVPFPGCAAEVVAGEIHLTAPGGGGPMPTGDLGLVRADGLLEFAGRIRERITLPGRRPLDPYAVEAAIRGHEGVGAVIVTGVDGTPDARGTRGARGARRLVAYVTPPSAPSATAVRPGVEELRTHLAGKVPEADMPQAVVRIRRLPRNRAGQEDRSALPLPARPGVPARTAKSGATASGEAPASCGVVGGTVVCGFAAVLLTDLLWPGSTDLTGVPSPWSALFGLLYVFEWLSFGAGAMFLLFARPAMRRHGRGRRLTSLAHVAVAYLLMAWWPQDNFYRLAAKNDWPRQAALVYAFNVPLMLAAGVVALYALSRPKGTEDTRGAASA